MTSAAELTAIAIDIAESAAAHVRVRRAELFDDAAAPPRSSSFRTKSTPTDPVTVADVETESMIRDTLSRLRPEDTVLGEEDGGTLEVPDGVRWVVDPIDGTVNFLYGIPAYAVSVGAQVGGVSVAGAVVDVAREITYSATRDAGAFRDDGTDRRRLRCTDVTSTALALVATGFGYDESRRRAQGVVIAELLPRVRDLRRVGSAALDLCMVAAGAVDAHFEHGLNPWDWAAGALIAEEAGAVVRVPGPRTRGSDGALTLAVAPGIAEEFTALLRRIGAFAALP